MYDIVIIGGGLAGSSAAIYLAQMGIRVLLLERVKYPQQRVCGEFLSVEVADILSTLGVYDDVIQLGASKIQQLTITAPGARPWNCQLPGVALGISRYRLDHLLFKRAASLGVDTREGVSALSVTGDLERGFQVVTSHGTFNATMALGAYGKKSRLDRALGRPQMPHECLFAAYKQHYRGVFPNKTVEVHTFDGGYCGINRVEDEIVNVCWTMRSSMVRRYEGGRARMATELFQQNPHLVSRLATLKPLDGSFAAIGGVSLERKSLFSNDICMIGDAAQMIAPFCGDGMGIALRSGVLAAPFCRDFIGGKMSRNQFIQNYTKTWNRAFRLRLMIGRVLQQVALSPCQANIALAALSVAPSAGKWIVQKTRGLSGGYEPISSKQPSIVKPGPNARAIP